MSSDEGSPFEIEEYLLDDTREEENKKWEDLLEGEKVWGASVLPDFGNFEE